jgi:hypothetical protein
LISGRLGRAAASLAWVVLAACGPEADTPEARVRAVLARAEEGAEARDLGIVKPLISERYADRNGHDRKSIQRLLAYHFLRSRSIHLLTRVDSVDFVEPPRAAVTVFVAMASTPIPGASDLARVRADLYRFDLTLAEETDGEFRLIDAGWRPAEVDDFF